MTVEELFNCADLSPRESSQWKKEISESSPGVYVVAIAKESQNCPLSPEHITNLNEGKLERERNRWLPDELIVYIGQTTGQSLAQRVHQFYIHEYGKSSPHRGGQAVHLLQCECSIYWAPTSEPKYAEWRMISAFVERTGKLPFANRQRPRKPNASRSSPTVGVSASLAIINIGQLVTLAGPARPRVGGELRELGIVADSTMLIEDGRIVAAGRSSELQDKIPAHAVLIDAQGRCVTPGFVDAHTHLVFAGNRAAEFEQRIAGATYQQIAAAGGGILSTVALTRAATEDELLACARRHRDWMLRSGTTTIEGKSGYGLDHATEFKMLRVLWRLGEDGPARIVPTLLAAHTVPHEFSGRREEYVRFVAEELIPEVAAAGLARWCDAFCDDHAFTVDECRVVLVAAKRSGLGLRIHAEQFRPGTGAALAAELGAATADHLETVDDAALSELRRAGVQPVLVPGSVFCLRRTQYPPARAMIDAGLAIVLATDFNPGSSPVASMPFVMSLACSQMGLTPAEALSAATINAAYSLGLGREIGSLEAGKQADFLIHECDDYRELAYFVAAPMRPRVFVAGTEVAVE